MNFGLKSISSIRIKYLQSIPTCTKLKNMLFAASKHTKPEKDTTVNAMEIETFSTVSDMWWDVKSPLRALHSLNKIRVPFVADALVSRAGTDVRNITILDVGCGGGILCEALSMNGFAVTGIDATKEVIDVAIQHSNSNPKLKIKPKYIFTTIEEHVTEYENCYDGVVASEVIEHIDNKELFVETCVRALKPGGSIFFTTPSKTRLSQIVNIWFGENVMNSPAKGVHQYEKFITPRDLQRLLHMSGCRTENIRGMIYNMVNNTWTWTYTKSLWFAIQAIKEK